MKLSTKLLTTLSSIAIVGTIVPATVSCSCGNKDYVFNYGDHINCKDKKDDDYHKIKDVQAAARKRAARVERREINDLDYINGLWNDNQGIKNFFYDLVASAVIIQEEEINFKNWKINEADRHVSFNWNGHEYNNATSLQYKFVDKTIWIYLYTTDEVELTYRSYTYYDCYHE